MEQIDFIRIPVIEDDETGEKQFELARDVCQLLGWAAYDPDDGSCHYILAPIDAEEIGQEVWRPRK